MQHKVLSAELVNTINFRMHGERVLTLIVGQNGVESLAYDEITGFLVASLRRIPEPRWIPMSNVKTMTMSVEPVAVPDAYIAEIKRGPGRPRKVVA